MSHLLLVDDEEAVCWALERALTRAGHTVLVAASAEEALIKVERQRPDAIFLDVCLPGLSGLDILARLGTATQNAPVIVATAYGNLTTAVRALEGGAFDYLAKPFDLDQALDAFARALQQRELAQLPPAAGPPVASTEEMIGRSPAMQVVFKRIALVAPRPACVLITGESGTGKELVARAIHRHSPRRDRPFLPVHLAALNPSLVESELFGHVRGAFTGATQAHPGLLALAEGGTVFLDELGDIPLPVQVKLLRVLEQNEVIPVGGTQPQRLDIRILAATHEDLPRRVAEGHFRHDLFFRLNVFQIHLPPLRERLDDLLPLAEHFLRRCEPGAGPLPPQTEEFLREQTWPGNVRELRNALEHAAILARGGPLRPEHFPRHTALAAGLSPTEQLALAVRRWVDEKVRTGTEPTALHEELLHAMESPLLDEVIQRVAGNRVAAARWLGLNRATVRKLLARYFPTLPETDKE